MTALCPGNGASQVKAGVNNTVLITAQALTAALSNVPVTYAVPFAALLAAITIDTTAMCITDPPAQPVMTALDWIALAGPPGLAAFTGAQQKFSAWVTYFLWWQMCQCVSGTATPPVIPAPPASPPQINPPASGPPPLNVPCVVFGPRALDLTANQGFNRGGPSMQGLAATGLRVTYANTVVVAPGPSVKYTVSFDHYVSNVLQSINTYFITYPSSVSNTFNLSIPPGTELLTFNVLADGNAGTTNASIYAEVFCGNTPGGAQLPCCPPDPTTQTLLSQILSMVTLIQRQAAPFHYVYGANHPGLTGTGTIAVSGLIGVSVQVTTIPAGAGLVAGNPNARFELGYVTMQTVDGAERSRKIDHDGVLMIPNDAGLFTSIGYTLPPGVVVAIRELVREP